MTTEIIIIVLASIFILNILIIALVLAKFSKTKQMTKEAEIAEMLGAEYEPGNWSNQSKLVGTERGRSYEIVKRIVNTGKSQITYLDMKTTFSVPDIKLKISKANAFTRFFKKIGLYHTIESGDPYFDAVVNVTGKPAEIFRALVYDGTFKDAAGKLAGRAYSVVLKNPNALATKLFSKKDLNADVLRVDVAALVSLVEFVEASRR